MKKALFDQAVESFQMYDNLGNCCAAALYKIGGSSDASEFELYLHDFNSSAPRRLAGKLGPLKSAMAAFFNRKLKEGFIQPLQGEQNGKARIS